MSKKYLDDNGLLYFWQKIKVLFVTDVSYDSSAKKIQKTKAGTTSDVVTLSTVATSGSYSDLSNKPTIPSKTSDLTNDSNFAVDASYVHTDNNYTSTEKTKLSGIESGAEVNVQSDWNQTTTTADDYIKNKPTIPTLKNVFGKVKVGSTTIEADTTQDTLELEAGSNVTLTPDATNDKVTIGVTIPPTGVTDVEVDGTSVVTGGVAEIDLTGKVDKVEGKDLSTNDYDDTEKAKLAGIEAGAEVNVQSDWSQSNNSADDYIKNKPTIPKVYYGTCTTVSGTAVKVVTCPEFSLETGAIINFYCSQGDTSGAPQFNINGTGAKYAYTSWQTKLTSFRSQELLTFVYDGLDYRIASHAQASTSAYGITKLSTAIDSTATNVAATPSAVKQAYDLADSKASTDVATTSANGLMSSTDKTKLDKLIFDGNNLIDSSILPSYVDDVIEAYPRSGQTELSSTWLSKTSGGSALTPETGKIYVLMADSTSYATNTQFRWSGSTYVKLSDGGVSEITNAEIDTIVAS